MILGLDRLRGGYDMTADAIVIGSGPGGAVAADNLQAAGMKTVVVEAGPEVRASEMTRDAATFLAKYYWEGGLRMVAGNSPNPAMMGRCLGGSSVVNSAIMLKLPDWVRQEWARGDHLWTTLYDPGFDRAFERVFARTKTAPTPLDVQGPRNLKVRDALTAMGNPSGPLPRAVDGCGGCADCITGCHHGAKQSMDRSYLPAFVQNGGTVCTCSVVDRVLVERGRAVGVEGRVVDIDGWRDVGRFRIRAPRVVMAAGVAHTPAILLKSGLDGGRRVGRSLYVHLSSGLSGVFDEVIDPWIGATQGWGAISNEIKGLKYEALWAATSLISVNWGGVGEHWYNILDDIRHTATMALVYKGNVSGRVIVRPDGLPGLFIHVPDTEIRPLMHGLKRAVDGLLAAGARHVTTSVWGVPERMRRPSDSDALLSPRVKPHHCHMTFNHMFGSCRMSADPRRGPVTPDGALRGVSGVWVADSSLFPAPSAVNPQATVMALSDLVSRRLAGLAA
jgi:choline dehydrogenase-like flavoprotein